MDKAQLDICFDETFKAWGSVIICPGGGYRWLSPREAAPVARRFEERRWRPFVLYYSVGERLGVVPLTEAAGALRFVRSHYAGPVVLCGFSAGGHLAASLGVHWDNAEIFPGPESRRTQRPDALILCYPVITAGKAAHQGSIESLAGASDADFFSLENHVSSSAPPSFIWHTAGDKTVPVENSLCFAEALIRNGVETELHIFPRGIHGLSLAVPELDEVEAGRIADPHVARWFDLSIEWLEGLFLKGGAA
ncbi:MAG: alpha/beta hydrolase [Treponema sp.]|nr:alpha/beta hydrolase [Treponema sp.]